MDQVDTIIIGAGVIGLACAREMAARGHDVVVVEAEDAIGTGTSSRNSEVIHAGIYYPEGSLKARFCVEGRHLLYAFCQRHGVACNPIGKLIVATSVDEESHLGPLLETGLKNGVDDLKIISGDEVQRMEPALKAYAAIHSPSTGLVDSHGLMLALQGELEDAGGMIALASPLTGGYLIKGGIVLSVGGEAPMELLARHVINAAGHGAWDVAGAIDGVNKASIPPHHLAKGTYFVLSGKGPFSQLIYPLPGPASLGMHYTLDLAGQAKFGPDVEWVDGMDYAVDGGRAEAFYRAVRSYWPGLPDGALTPGYAGIRPKVQAPGEEARDFVIQGPETHGIKGLVNLYGIESPGLTASLAIARHVGDLLA